MPRKLKRQGISQQVLYEPIRAWLLERAFRVLITGDGTTFVIPVRTLVPMPYKIPDLVAVREDNRVAIVEVETDQNQFFHALGRCMLWKSTATFVYLAYPSGVVSLPPLLDRLGVGMLEVNATSGSVAEVVRLPLETSELSRVWELHPLDFNQESELAKQIKAIPENPG